MLPSYTKLTTTRAPDFESPNYSVTLTCVESYVQSLYIHQRLNALCPLGNGGEKKQCSWNSGFWDRRASRLSCGSGSYRVQVEKLRPHTSQVMRLGTLSVLPISVSAADITSNFVGCHVIFLRVLMKFPVPERQ